MCVCVVYLIHHGKGLSEFSENFYYVVGLFIPFLDLEKLIISTFGINMNSRYKNRETKGEKRRRGSQIREYYGKQKRSK